MILFAFLNLVCKTKNLYWSGISYVKLGLLLLISNILPPRKSYMFMYKCFGYRLRKKSDTNKDLLQKHQTQTQVRL